MRQNGETLKAVVGKGSLRLAIMQRWVGPKCPMKIIKQIVNFNSLW